MTPKAAAGKERSSVRFSPDNLTIPRTKTALSPTSPEYMMKRRTQSRLAESANEKTYSAIKVGDLLRKSQNSAMQFRDAKRRWRELGQLNSSVVKPDLPSLDAQIVRLNAKSNWKNILGTVN